MKLDITPQQPIPILGSDGIHSIYVKFNTPADIPTQFLERDNFNRYPDPPISE